MYAFGVGFQVKLRIYGLDGGFGLLQRRVGGFKLQALVVLM